MPKAKDKNIALIRTPAGYTLAPMVGDKVIMPEQFSELTEEEQDKLQETIGELQTELQKIVSQLPVLKREASHRIKALNEEITQLTVEQFVASLEQRYADDQQIMEYLSAVKTFAIENAEDFSCAVEEEKV